MSRFSVLMAEVPHGKADMVSQAAVSAGSFGGTVLMGRRIGSNALAVALGIASSTVDILCILVEEETKQAIQESIRNACCGEKKNFGCMYDFDAGSLVRAGESLEGDVDMEDNKGYDLITVILNRGYGDDAMAAARKAGAGGGTIVNARGTAREDDAKFFGMHIVPEKEMLLVVVPAEKKDAVLEAIRTLPCLSEPGSGIAFCSPVNGFTLLGKQN